MIFLDFGILYLGFTEIIRLHFAPSLDTSLDIILNMHCNYSVLLNYLRMNPTVERRSRRN